MLVNLENKEEDTEIVEGDMRMCPFCGESEAIGIGKSDANGAYFGFCDNCDASTGYYTTGELALEAWNQRAYIH